MNTSIKPVLFTSKTLSNGEHPVMLRITKDRKPTYMSVGFSCSKEHWNFSENHPKKSHPLYKEATMMIQAKKHQASKTVFSLETEEKDLSSGEIKHTLKRTRRGAYSVDEYFEIVIKKMKEEGRLRTADGYKDTLRNLQYFSGKRKKQFPDITVSFLSDFEGYLKGTGKGPNTRYIYLRTLRAVINRAIKEGVCLEKHYAFKNFSLAKYAKIKTAKRAISKTDMQKIVNCDLTDNPEVQDARNIFLFSYYCRGMNYTDIADLKWSDVKSGRIIYVRQKTKERFSIGLLEPAKEILKQYRKNRKSDDDYVFPILSEKHDTPTAIYNRKKKMLNYTNKHLKTVAEKAEIDVVLTTYVARHSFATVLKRQGINTSMISEMLGHDSEKTTQIYLDSFENAVLDEVSLQLL